MSTKINSLDDIVGKMKGRSVTAKWDAIISYNRTMTNNILQQAYVKNFALNTWWPPISGEIQTESTSGKYILKDIIFSEPILSFEPQDEFKFPVVKLTWLIVGGSYSYYEGADKIYTVQATPLGGHQLSGYAPVMGGGGTITDGRVYLDLEETFKFVFTSSSSNHENELTGALIRNLLIKELPADQKQIVISEIEADPQGVFNPTKFKLKTQLAPVAPGRAAEYYNDGAVVVYVALDDNPVGGNTSDELYLIPDDGDYSAAIVISNEALMNKILKPGLELQIGTGNLSVICVDADRQMYKIEVAAGAVDLKDYKFFVGSTTVITISESTVPLGPPNAKFEMLINEMGVDISWLGGGAVGCNIPSSPIKEVLLSWRKYIAGKMVLVGDTEINLDAKDPGGGVIFVMKEGAPPGWDKSWPDTIAANYAEVFGNGLNTALEVIGSSVPVFNTSVLQSILFENSNVVSLKQVRTPGDLIVFGALRSSLASFEIVDPMPRILAGAEHQLTTKPAANNLDLTWTVEALADTRGSLSVNLGTITPCGIYKAPEQLEGIFIQVKVSAYSAALGVTRYALLTVGVNAIEASPYVFKCDFESTRIVTASAVDRANVVGRLTPTSKSTLVHTSDAENSWIFTAAKAPPVDADDPLKGTLSYLLEPVLFESETSASSTIYALCVSKNQVYDISFEVSADAKKIQFKAKLNQKEKVCHWTLVLGDGDGELDPNTGIYTRPTVATREFIIVYAVNASDPDLSGVEIFGTDFDVASQRNLFRPRHARVFDQMDVDAIMKADAVKRNKYCK